jgi:hypothetical protein
MKKNQPLEKKRSTAPTLLIVAYALSTSVAAQTASVEEDLRRQLHERDAVISDLREQLDRLRSQQPSAPPATGGPAGTVPHTGSSMPATRDAAAPAGVATAITPATSANEEDELASALESSLIGQGGAVLSPGTVEVQPELSYSYDEPENGRRRDGFGTALSLRLGLPADVQADVNVPYVIREHQAGSGSTSGFGDVSLGLTRQLLKDQDRRPALLVFGRWRTTTGDIDRTLSTGLGQHGIQLGVTSTKRMDPVLLIGSLFYTANLGSARLGNGMRVDAGNVFGVRLGANLAATPDTSFFWGVSYNSSSADRLNDERIDVTDRARGFLELASTTVTGRGRFFNLGIRLGVTPAAPKFSVTGSLPFRF